MNTQEDPMARIERTRRPIRNLFLAVALATVGGAVVAQEFAFDWNPRSGDVWVDTYLHDINQYGSRYREPFMDELVRYHGAPRDLVRELLIDRHWAPGDVYYACAIASVLGRPCRYVAQEWDRDHGQGWGALAQRLGIKPGSAEFHRLKRGFVPSYDRWGRPIELDGELLKVFPDRRRNDKANAPRGQTAHGKNKPAKGKPAKGKPAKGKPGKGAGKPGKGLGKD
jgi:hypothetical protein